MTDCQQQGILSQCDNGHEQRLYTPDMSQDQVYSFASLLDGTSLLYRYPPRQFDSKWSTVGKCGICGGWLTCTVFGYASSDTEKGSTA